MTTTASARSVSDSTTVAAPPEAVFALLADPRRHAEIDGSGTVRGTVRGPGRLAMGSRFSMRMRLGVPYLVTCEVVEFEEGRRIAWRHFGRHIWRYELEAVPGGTLVTETFDYATARSPGALERAHFPERNLRGITATLTRMRELFAA